MTITILSEVLVNDIDTGLPISRTAKIAIDDGLNTYRWAKGGLPLTGDLQPILDAEEPKLLAAAKAAGSLLPPDEADRMGAKRWFKDNPAAKSLYTDSIHNIESQVVTLIDNMFPSASAADKNKLRLLWMSDIVSNRVFARRLDLLD